MPIHFSAHATDRLRKRLGRSDADREWLIDNLPGKAIRAVRDGAERVPVPSLGIELRCREGHVVTVVAEPCAEEMDRNNRE